MSQRACASAGDVFALILLAHASALADEPVKVWLDSNDSRVVTRFEADGLARDLPLGQSGWSLLETLEPAAIVDRIEGAGLYPGEPGRFSLHGPSWTANTVRLDGVDVSDPLHGGTPLLLPDVASLRSIEVVSALAPAEYEAAGATLELRTREPASTWQGSIQGSGLGSGLQSHSAAGGVPPIARFGSLLDASALASGPLAGERQRVLSALRFADVNRFERADPSARRSRLASGLVELAWAPGPRDRVRLVAAAQRATRPLAGAVLYPGAALSEADDTLGASGHWGRDGDRASLCVDLGYWRGRFTPERAGVAPAGTVERLRDGPVPELVFPLHSRRATASGAARLALQSSHLAADLWHAPRIGLSIREGQSTESSGDSGPIGETVDGLPARVWDYAWGASDSHREATELALWASERMAWRERVFVEAGARLEKTRGDARGALQGVSWTTLLPRVSARVRLTDAGRLTLLGGWGEYGHRLRLDALAFGDPNGPAASIYRWNDSNGDGRYEPDERGELVARVGPGASDPSLSSIDPKLKRPVTRELVAGLELAPGEGWRLAFTAFDRRDRDSVESVDVGAPASAYDVRYLPDPGGDIVGSEDDQLLPVYARRPESFGQDRYMLTNPASHPPHHQGAQLRVEGRLGGRLRLFAGATASRTELQGGNRGFRVDENDPGVIGELFDDPNVDTYSWGRGFFDRAFTVKLAVAWRGPGDLRLGLVTRYQDGQPFSRLVVVPDLPQGPEAIQATSRGQTFGRTASVDPEGRLLSANGHRFSYTLTLDLRAEKGFRLGRRRLAVVAEAFNLLGLDNEVEEDAVWGTAFRDPTAVQPPRVVRLGARFDF
jgi:hypothetical protein